VTQVDVAIVGGGLVGASMAIALARSGRQVAVIEAASRQADHQPSYDDRTLVINAASLNILRHLELLPEPERQVPIETIEISRAGGFGHLTLRSQDYGQTHFGAVIVARELGNVMLDAMATHDRIIEFCPAKLAGFETAKDRVVLSLEDGRQLSTKLLIGADGNHSRVRELAGLACQRHDYRQSAMIFNVTPDQAPAATAWERFTPAGPLALLPQPGGRLGVVWIDGSEAVKQAMTMDDASLTEQLQSRFGTGLGNFARPGKRACYPLHRQRTAWPISERTVVIGNAANAVHPVSAQGFNLGLRDVAGLVDALEDCDDPGQQAGLVHYARSRQADQEATVRYTDTLARAFTNPSSPARVLGGLGLAAHAGWPGLRRRLVQAAMGFRPPISRLARPLDAGDRKP